MSIFEFDLLHSALRDNDFHVLEFLLKNKVNPNSMCQNEGIILLYSAKKANMDFIKCLVDYGADVNHKDNRGDGVLHWIGHNDMPMGLKNNIIPCLQFFIDRGIDINLKNNEGLTVLHTIACRDEQVVLEGYMEFLLDNGCDPYLTDNQGNNMFDLSNDIPLSSEVDNYLTRKLAENDNQSLIDRIRIEVDSEPVDFAF